MAERGQIDSIETPAVTITLLRSGNRCASVCVCVCVSSLQIVVLERHTVVEAAAFVFSFRAFAGVYMSENRFYQCINAGTVYNTATKVLVSLNVDEHRWPPHQISYRFCSRHPLL